MRGDRKITQAPSTDQKRVRRQMQRKTANFDDPADIQRVASMPLDSYLASIGDDLSEIEVEAGIRDWWRARNTAFDPLANSGLPGKPAAPCLNCGGHGLEPSNPMATCRQCAGTGSQTSTTKPGSPSNDAGCLSCQGTGQGFNGESCPRCAGTGKANSRNPNFAIPADGPAAPATAPATRTVLPASSFGHTAAMNDVGDCRLCEGPLVAKSTEGSTTKAECRDCGTEHSLQTSQVNKSAAAKYAEFQNLDPRTRSQIESLAGYLSAEKGKCPACDHKGEQKPYGHAMSSETGHQTMVKCLHCGHTYKHYDPADNEAREERAREKARGHGVTAAARTASLLSLVGSTWEVVVDTTPYVHTGMSAIARRAQSVLDTEENS
jgi:DNA-directed RNA polymerase subunit M/transcription elongation factor TFIIS